MILTATEEWKQTNILKGTVKLTDYRSNCHKQQHINDRHGKKISVRDEPICAISESVHFHHDTQVLLLLVHQR